MIGHKAKTPPATALSTARRGGKFPDKNGDEHRRDEAGQRSLPGGALDDPEHGQNDRDRNGRDQEGQQQIVVHRS